VRSVRNESSVPAKSDRDAGNIISQSGLKERRLRDYSGEETPEDGDVIVGGRMGENRKKQSSSSLIDGREGYPEGVRYGFITHTSISSPVTAVSTRSYKSRSYKISCKVDPGGPWLFRNIHMKRGRLCADKPCHHIEATDSRTQIYCRDLE
jgi:hypothetical protein